VLRSASAGAEPATAPPQTERRQEPLPKPQPNGHTHPPSRGESASGDSSASGGPGLGALVEEAQTLKAVLHDARGRSARLVAALKRQKKQSRLMASILAGLRQLQQFQSVAG
jgi:hypothetical protein